MAYCLRQMRLIYWLAISIFPVYVQLSDNLKNKQIRILVGLDVDLQISGHICEVEAIRKRLTSRGAVKEEYYEQLVKLINESDFLDTAEKQEQFKMFYGKVLDGTLEIRKHLNLVTLRCICSPITI